jgi:thiol-disulfide isomerase/thioredoxin
MSPAAPAPTQPSPAPAALVKVNWTPPAVIPAYENWTWTTPHETYKNVQIVKVEADCVTILHSAGGALVRISDLPADLQKLLNYNSSAAAAAAAQRQLDDAASARVLAQERSAGAGGGSASDYASAIALAKTTGKKVLVHFTGSDWCPYCQKLEEEVISTSDFAQFAAANYIFVTLDFPHNIPQTDEVKRANSAVAAKYGINGYPTLLVIDGDEKVLGRMSGYDPGTGPGPVIAQLKSF